MPQVNIGEWKNFLLQYPNAHILQSAEWGTFKAAFGWNASWVVGEQLGAQILIKKYPLGMQIAYIAKGPVGLDSYPIHKWGGSNGYKSSNSSNISWWSMFLREIDQVCIKNKVSFLIIEPDIWEKDTDVPMCPEGLVAGINSIQPKRTILIDISQSEEQLLSKMKQKTRYNIRLAQKKGVMVGKSNNLDVFFDLVLASGKRDGFAVHSNSYYQQVFDIYHPINECQLFVAEHEGKLLATLMVFARGNRSWYLYGGSSDENREYMSTYLIQWEAMCWAKSRGCISYDLWGIPDYPEDELEKSFMKYSNGLWGVYRFKRGFGGEIQLAAGPWIKVYNKPRWEFYKLLVRIRKGGIG